MTLVFYDRVAVTVASAPGTSTTISLGSAVASFQGFSAAGASNGDTFSYLLLDGNNWEYGVGTYSSSGPTVSRTTVTSSSAGGTTKINASSGAIVVATLRAEDLSNLGSGTLAGDTDVSLSSPTNGQVLTYNSGASKWENANASGGGLFNQIMSATPTASSTGLSTWVNQSSSSHTDGAVGLYLDVPHSGGGNYSALVGSTLPSAPYTVTALVTVSRQYPSSYDFFGIGFANPSTSAAQFVGLYNNNGAAATLAVIEFNSPTSVNGITNSLSTPNFPYTTPIWLRLKNDGTNVHFSWSYDGVSFGDVASVSVSSGFMSSHGGYVNACIFANGSSVDTTMTLLSWSVTTP